MRTSVKVELIDANDHDPRISFRYFPDQTARFATVEENAVPGNLVAVTWVPQITVLQAADLMIFHGGTASLCEAVSSGTPMLVYPQSNDQKGSAARVVYHGLGRAGRFDDPVENIETDISAILDDCIIKKNLYAAAPTC